MTKVWDKFVPLSKTVINKFRLDDSIAEIELPPEYEYVGYDFSWKNYMFQSNKFRRAHIEIVDAMLTKKMWVMHMTIFPYYDDPSPIFGFDVVCGANKITGAFHDFSKAGESPVYNWYQNKMAEVSWNKPRELPDWAKRIFSPNMLAAGNIGEEDELDKLANIFIDNLDYYLYNIGNSSEDSFIEQHNQYCINQKKNPHTPAMMVNFGVDKDIFMRFMDDVLFPEYNGN